jgi:hypothetical protein
MYNITLITQTYTIKMSTIPNTHEFPPKTIQPINNHSKNGYEIRSDILAIAKDIRLREFDVEFEIWKLLREENPTMPKFPTIDNIIETAGQLYSFVNVSTRK